MRFFSILLAGVFLSVVGCGGGDATDDSTSGVRGPTGADLAPAGLDPKDMPVDEVKDDDGKVIDPGGKEDPPEGESVIPEQVGKQFGGAARKKGAKEAKKEAPKKEAPKKKADGGKKTEKEKG
jgi:hypothetical protein